ncbi:hypothetical protein [Halorubrum sp. AJ67]|uniref:hypothetical protein n=1 Tax=Halorubrum sp. AJ67 TaxID=1173487 RepID=UPI0003DB6986|nr:hypothetical protein [Halorubrum sp. AJ67]CDK38034.1 putative lipoprotein [Halorubrum sp. AJ67]
MPPSRRNFLIASSSASLISLAGCTGETKEYTAEFDRVWSEDLQLNARITAPSEISEVIFETADGQIGVDEVTEDNPVATCEIGEAATIGTAEQSYSHDQEFTITLRDTEGTRFKRTEWTYAPAVRLTDVHTAESMGYQPVDGIQAATPILEITNRGRGPTRIDKIIVRNPSQDVPLTKGIETTSFANAAIAPEPNSGRFTPVNPHELGGYFLSEGDSTYLAIDDLLTHEGDPPEQVETAGQNIDINIGWLFDSPTFKVNLTLSGGITQTNGLYHFAEFTTEKVDFASPLK